MWGHGPSSLSYMTSAIKWFWISSKDLKYLESCTYFVAWSKINSNLKKFENSRWNKLSPGGAYKVFFIRLHAICCLTFQWKKNDFFISIGIMWAVFYECLIQIVKLYLSVFNLNHLTKMQQFIILLQLYTDLIDLEVYSEAFYPWTSYSGTDVDH